MGRTLKDKVSFVYGENDPIVLSVKQVAEEYGISLNSALKVLFVNLNKEIKQINDELQQFKLSSISNVNLSSTQDKNVQVEKDSNLIIEKPIVETKSIPIPVKPLQVEENKEQQEEKPVVSEAIMNLGSVLGF